MGDDWQPDRRQVVLAEIVNAALRALMAATYGVPQTAPGPLACIGSAFDWMNRRANGGLQRLRAATC